MILTEHRHQHKELELPAVSQLTVGTFPHPPSILNSSIRSFLPSSQSTRCVTCGGPPRVPVGASVSCAADKLDSAASFFLSLMTLEMVLSNCGCSLSELLIPTSHSDSWQISYSWVSVTREAALVVAAAEWQRRQGHNRSDPGGIQKVLGWLLNNSHILFLASLKPH